MALVYTDGGGHGIFDVLGKLFAAAGQVNTSRGTDVPGKIDALVDQFKNDTATTAAMELAMSLASQGQISWQGSGDTILGQLQQAAQGYLRGVVLRDAPQPVDSIDNALRYLIAQMVADDVYVDPNVVGASLAAGSGNSSTDLAIMYTKTGGDGAELQNQLAEDVAISLTSVVETAITIATRGEASAPDLSADWPAGSNHSRQFGAIDPADSLLTNGDFEDAAIANVPDDWLMMDGLPGTAYLLTTPEVQDLAVAGTPTAGGYYIRYTDPATSIVHITSRLAYNATSADVQEALRSLPGLASITVATQAGSDPNYTHRITFTGVAGNVAALAVENQLDTGTITPSEVTAGDANAYRGVSLKVVGSAAANRRIYHALPTLTPDTVYFLSLRHKKTGTPAAGDVRVAIVSGYGGSVVQDSAGNNNSVTYDLTAGTVTTSFTAGWLAIRIPPDAVQPLYLEIDVQNLSAGTTYCLDDVTLSAGQQLYTGGPIVGAVAGKVAPALSDVWTLSLTNNRAGTIQEWMNRFYGMRGRGLLLPTAGSTNIPDSLVA